MPTPVLHLVCGKIASGKSTLTAQLSESVETVVIAEDDWLAALYSEEMSSIADFVRCSIKLRTIIGPHVASLLRAGVSVVLDFQANTVDSRQWMREIIRTTTVAHQLHHLDVSDDICLARLHQRNASGDHAFSVTDEQFLAITKHFVAPQSEEGFNVIIHRAEATQ